MYFPGSLTTPPYPLPHLSALAHLRVTSTTPRATQETHGTHLTGPSSPPQPGAKDRSPGNAAGRTPHPGSGSHQPEQLDAPPCSRKPRVRLLLPQDGAQSPGKLPFYSFLPLLTFFYYSIFTRRQWPLAAKQLHHHGLTAQMAVQLLPRPLYRGPHEARTGPGARGWPGKPSPRHSTNSRNSQLTFLFLFNNRDLLFQDMQSKNRGDNNDNVSRRR